jgi:hypothetical protein
MVRELSWPSPTQLLSFENEKISPPVPSFDALLEIALCRKLRAHPILVLNYERFVGTGGAMVFKNLSIDVSGAGAEPVSPGV